MMNMNVSLIVEIVLSVLLLATISYSALLERRPVGAAQGPGRVERHDPAIERSDHLRRIVDAGC